VGFIKDSTKAHDHGYYYMNMFFIAINAVGLILNLNLYYIDIKYNNGVLDKIDQGREAAQQSIEAGSNDGAAQSLLRQQPSASPTTDATTTRSKGSPN